jgi:Kef-type K+ transport system membrane component KefB
LNLSNGDILHLLLALTALLALAHVLGFVFVSLRQPRVAGEIVGGLVLGPTFLGWLNPDWEHQLLSGNQATVAVLGALYQLGQLLLMFCAGAALGPGRGRAEWRTTGLIAVVGNALPFAAGIVFLALLDPGNLVGAAANRTSFILVFCCAVAVTSIPVISRIMADLGILGTGFARVVLSVAVLEDFVLYIVLSIALGLVASSSGAAFTLPGILAIHPGTAAAAAYYVVASIGVFGLPLILGRSFAGRVGSLRGNVLGRSNELAFQVVFMMVLTSAALFLGVSPIFGAFVAGILAGTLPEPAAQARETIQTFAFGFFIPIYFALVGAQLDLIHQLDIPFLVLFLAYACAVKALSVFAAARLAGQHRAAAVNLAVALNARGGPAIVLASVALAAHIISERFYVDLVLLALVTSVMAGAWLGREQRRGTFALDGGPAARPVQPGAVDAGVAATSGRRTQPRDGN